MNTLAECSEATALTDLSQALGGDVTRMEEFMLAQEQVPCPVIHRFGPGVYMREVKIPAGTMAVGHHQNFEHMNIVLAGRVTILQDDGSTTEVVAPTMYVGKPGRKVGYIHEDLVWLNIYATTETDIDRLEAHFVTKSDVWSQLDGERTLLLENFAAKGGYAMAMAQAGIDETAIHQRLQACELTELPPGGYKIKTARSFIDGRGLHATADIAPGELIAPAWIGVKQTIAGRFTNHSPTPNARIERASNGDLQLVATRPIEGCRGGVDGEEITVDYRLSLALTSQIGLEK